MKEHRLWAMRTTSGDGITYIVAKSADEAIRFFLSHVASTSSVEPDVASVEYIYSVLIDED